MPKLSTVYMTCPLLRRTTRDSGWVQDEPLAPPIRITPQYILSTLTVPYAVEEFNKLIHVFYIYSPPDATVVNNHRFTQIKISGVFPITKTMISPTTLDISLLPLDRNKYEYMESEELVDKVGYKKIEIEMTEFDHHLLTFGIYGLDFNSSSATHFMAALALVIVSILAHFI